MTSRQMVGEEKKVESWTMKMWYLKWTPLPAFTSPLISQLWYFIKDPNYTLYSCFLFCAILWLPEVYFPLWALLLSHTPTPGTFFYPLTVSFSSSLWSCWQSQGKLYFLARVFSSCSYSWHDSFQNEAVFHPKSKESVWMVNINISSFLG